MKQTDLAHDERFPLAVEFMDRGDDRFQGHVFVARGDQPTFLGIEAEEGQGFFPSVALGGASEAVAPWSLPELRWLA